MLDDGQPLARHMGLASCPRCGQNGPIYGRHRTEMGDGSLAWRTRWRHRDVPLSARHEPRHRALVDLRRRIRCRISSLRSVNAE
ncbi:hypothetical protein [Paraburkholderia hospita]|uniref:hypothetical protein n=1 Tax=Paraburkholderia hospita TaxID=169430 RepID=UPI0031344FCC